MEAKTNEALDTARETIDLFNSAKNQKVKDNLRDKLKHDLNKLYMSYDSINDKFILNDMLPKLELYNFQVNEVVYKSGLSIKKSCEDNGIETITLTRSPTGHPTKLNPCKSSLAGISISLKMYYVVNIHSGILSYIDFHQESSSLSHLANHAKMVFCHFMRFL